MSQKKVSVVIEPPKKTNDRSRKTSEGSSTKGSLTRGTPSTPGKRSSVAFQDGRHMSIVDADGHGHHRRDSSGQLLMLPVDLTRRRRSQSWQGHPIPTVIEFEPTYRLEPTGKVPVKSIQSMMNTEVDGLLRDLDYSTDEAPSWAQILTERLKSETKCLLPPENRYKIVVSVVVVPKSQQGIQISSRCLWDTEYDTIINSVYENKDIHATATVYCVYAP
ncbi:dynein light chain Tctex-type 5-like [Watersipora subatra]|uniref:dynein light chain Tctex-type 5-like n=1 Tax=Watersipora subatra TaxID=2589382 RepID=UPI00355BCFF7